jgi:hypothetical protein
MLGFSLLLQWLCWERNWSGSRGPLSCAERWIQEHFFLRAVVSIQLCWVSIKGCHIWGLPAGSVRGLAWEAYVLCVSGFPYRVYIDSNYRDSQI